MGDFTRNGTKETIGSDREISKIAEVADVGGEGTDEIEIGYIQCCHMTPGGITRDPQPSTVTG